MSTPAEQGWSVCLVLEEGELNRISGSEVVFETMSGAGISSIVFAAADDGGDLGSLVFELTAPDTDAAEGRAQNLAFQFRRAAGLPNRQLPVAWVLPLRDGDASSARFLEQAKDLLASESYELAVIAAHMHLELQVKALIERAVGEERPKWIDTVMSVRGIGNLNSPVCQEMIRNLLGFEVTELEHWDGFRAHAKRRNAVAHDGLPLEEEHAAESIETVKAITLELGRAARKNDA